MRKILALIVLTIFIYSCKSKSAATSRTEEKPEKPAFVMLKPSAADAAQSKKAYELGTRVLMTCNTSRFKPFSESEATASVIQNTTQARLTRTCHKFRLKYGDFKKLDLIEVIHFTDSDSYIYRYRAHYEKPIANKELRVTMNSENKVSAIKSSDWIDNYNPLEDN